MFSTAFVKTFVVVFVIHHTLEPRGFLANERAWAEEPKPKPNTRKHFASSAYARSWATRFITRLESECKDNLQRDRYQLQYRTLLTPSRLYLLLSLESVCVCVCVCVYFSSGFTPIMLTGNKCSFGFLSPVCIHGTLSDSVYNVHWTRVRPEQDSMLGIFPKCVLC